MAGFVACKVYGAWSLKCTGCSNHHFQKKFINRIFCHLKMETKLRFEVFSLELLWTLNVCFRLPPPLSKGIGLSMAVEGRGNSLPLENSSHQTSASYYTKAKYESLCWVGGWWCTVGQHIAPISSGGIPLKIPLVLPVLAFLTA